MLRTAALAFAMTVTTGSAFAAESAADFQLYVLRDLSLVGDQISQRAAVGGDATFSGTSIGGATAANPASLVVGGDLTYLNGGSINGQALVGGADKAPDYMPVVGGVASLPVDFTAENLRLKNLSATLAKEAATGAAELKWGGLFLTGLNSGLNVFNVDAATLSQASWFNTNIAPGSQVLINVLGDNVQLRGGLYFYQPSNILWNFAQASSISAGGVSLAGSILAPNATFVGSGGSVAGSMIVDNFKGSISLGGAGYAGDLLRPKLTLPSALPGQAPGAVPEPATWAMMLMGLFGLGGVLRARRRGLRRPAVTVAA